MNFICPNCGSNSLVESHLANRSNNNFLYEKLCCDNCGSKFFNYYGIPYLGEFYQEDLLSVMEITSFLYSITFNQIGRPIRKTQKDQSLEFRKIRQLMHEICIKGEDNFNFEKHGYDVRPRWLDARLNGHRQFEQTISGLQFTNKSLLDIGAGTGFDACWFDDLGAKVYCLEYNPLQVALAKADFPQFEWFGASSEKIPYADESFDYVVANHALHHMLHLEQALEEMLRVLKVGGYLLTIADSYSPNTFTESDEVHVFNNHDAVLRGVNEQLPQLYKFINPLNKACDSLEVEILTPIVHGLHKRRNEMMKWSLDDANKILSKHRGGICMRIKKVKPIENKIRFTKNKLINFDKYVSSLTSRTTALTSLAAHLPKEYIDLPIICQLKPKFRLLLGWKEQNASENFRRAKKEAHLFYTKNRLIELIKKLYFSIPFNNNCFPVKFIIKLNDEIIYSKEIHNKRIFNPHIQTNDIMSKINDFNLLTFKIENDKELIGDDIFHAHEENFLLRTRRLLSL